AVQTNIRGYLIHANPDLLQEYRKARAALPGATLGLQSLVAGDRVQSQRAQEIRDEALSYVDNYGDEVVARTRENGVGAGRAYAAAADGGALADSLEARISALAEAEQAQSQRRRSPGAAPPPPPPPPPLS